MHSHHSHSGSYISHAKDDIDSIVKRADKMGFTHFCLTEHMPRLRDDYLYPEEKDKEYTVRNLEEDFNNYLQHALRLQCEYSKSSRMKILVGTEIEGLDDEHIQYAKELLNEHPEIVMTVGSVHHVHEIPIDFNEEMWRAARSATVDKSTRSLYKDYFDLQYKVISQLKPLVIGHFDLIRLFTPKEDIDPSTGKKISEINLENEWPDVWALIHRNVEAAIKYGGLFELNSAALRKGWPTPYPQKDICDLVIRLGGKFCLSDDSHAVSQVGLNYDKLWSFVRNDLKLEKLYALEVDIRGEKVTKEFDVNHLDKCEFWKQYI